MPHVVCFVGLLAATGISAAGETPIAVPVEGEPFPARLAAVAANWQITFDAGGKRRVLPAAELVLWGTCAEAPQGPTVVLADGGLLAVSRLAPEIAADKAKLTAEFELFGPCTLPLELLSGLVFHPPAAVGRLDLLLDRVVQATGQSDRLVLTNGDQITGLVEQIKDGVVRLATDVGPLEVERQRIAALVFNPALRQPAKEQGLRAWAGLSDGSRLNATELLLERSSLRITTTGGRTWKSSPEDLVWLQPLGGRVTYLSDLKPAEYRHVPFFQLEWPYRIDRNVTGGRLRCGGRLYLKGLGVHSAARLTYALSGPYRIFQAELGIDDSARGGGSVRFRVFVDGQEKYASGAVRGGMAPVPVSLDVSGGKRLDLVVDYADRADELDHADWLDARLVR